MKIEVWFDFVCPFCYLGERKLELALKEFEHRDDVELVFKSFELQMASESAKDKDINQILSDKYHISYAQAKANNDSIAEAARQVGLDFRFDLFKVRNTGLAHEMVHYAEKYGKSHALVRRIFKGVFTEGIDLSEEEAFLKLAEETGLDLKNFKELQSSGALKEQVQRDEEEAARLGINSIPHFIINGNYVVSGAQSPEYFLETLNKAYHQ